MAEFCRAPDEVLVHPNGEGRKQREKMKTLLAPKEKSPCLPMGYSTRQSGRRRWTDETITPQDGVQGSAIF